MKNKWSTNNPLTLRKHNKTWTKEQRKCSRITKKPKKRKEVFLNPETSLKHLFTRLKISWRTKNLSDTLEKAKENICPSWLMKNKPGTMNQRAKTLKTTKNNTTNFTNLSIELKRESSSTMKESTSETEPYRSLRSIETSHNQSERGSNGLPRNRSMNWEKALRKRNKRSRTFSSQWKKQNWTKIPPLKIRIWSRLQKQLKTSTSHWRQSLNQPRKRRRRLNKSQRNQKPKKKHKSNRMLDKISCELMIWILFDF